MYTASKENAYGWVWPFVMNIPPVEQDLPCFFR
jgi:hypothetical protein